MKYPSDLYPALVAAMRKVKETNPTVTPQGYIDAKVGKDHARRFRWDAYWAAKHHGAPAIPSDLLDEHVDTALRKAVKEVWN